METNTMKSLKYILLLSFIAIFMACNGSQKSGTKVTEQQQVAVNVPVFNPDSAYIYIQEQVDFGPRVPNSEAHIACGEYLVNKLKEYGATVITQPMSLMAYNGTELKAMNIIGQYSPEKRKRVLLCAHWDSRPWADNDKDSKNYHTPIDGANDGASGVGVLLEVARQLQQQNTEIGIDLIFFDAEDYGVASFDENNHKEDSWCLGSQYWSRRPHVSSYNARYGILLDMVGGKGATFYKEQFSQHYAKSIVTKVWNTAQRLGYGQFFPLADEGGYVTDDHYYINTIAKIPTLDIINCDVNNERSSFGDRWHTIDDTMEGIDKGTLKAVGQTVLEVIYNEK